MNDSKKTTIKRGIELMNAISGMSFYLSGQDKINDSDEITIGQPDYDREDIMVDEDEDDIILLPDEYEP